MTDQVVDRGDDFVPTGEDDAAAKAAALAATEAAEKEAAIAAAEKEAAEKEAAGKAAAAEAAEKGEQARDEKGKFTGKEPPHIPKARVDEMVARERQAREAAERRAAELEAQLKQVDRGAETAKLEEDIVALEKEHAKAILDGNADKAAEVAGKIRVTERLIQTASSTQMTAQAKDQMREEIRLDIVIDQLKGDFPALDDTNEAFDQDAVDMVLATQSVYIERDRMTPSQALAKAAEKVMAKLAPPAADEKVEDEKKGLDDAKKNGDRKEAQIDKNIKASAAQPADLKGAGLDSDKAGIQDNVEATKLSFEEFSALPEATKARMRGDYV